MDDNSITKIALLRGINVGGHRKILMKDLKSLFLSFGFTSVITYIQSGNVIFRSVVGEDNYSLSTKIADAIRQEYGFEVPVIIVEASEIGDAISSNPFFERPDVDLNKLSLTFLQKKPTPEYLTFTKSFQFNPDEFKIVGKRVYLLCNEPFHKTKLSIQFFEKNLETSATSRNWKTVLKLWELAQSFNK